MISLFRKKPISTPPPSLITDHSSTPEQNKAIQKKVKRYAQNLKSSGDYTNEDINKLLGKLDTDYAMKTIIAKDVNDLMYKKKIAAKVEQIANVTYKIAEFGRANLPQAIHIAAGIGVTVAGSVAIGTGIGLPIAIAAAIAVATIMRAYQQNIELQILLNKHFQQLSFIIKNFALIQQTLALLKIDVPRKIGSKVQGFDQIHIKLSEAFQGAVLQYMLVVQSQVPVKTDTTSMSLIGKTISKIRQYSRKIKHFFSGEAVIRQLNELFPSIERFYFLEIARFTSLVFFNLNNFNNIVSKIKITTIYKQFAEAQLMIPVPPCNETVDKKDVCILPANELNKLLEKDLFSLKAIVSPEEFEVAKSLESNYRTNIQNIITENDIITKEKRDSIDVVDTVKEVLSKTVTFGIAAHDQYAKVKGDVAAAAAAAEAEASHTRRAQRTQRARYTRKQHRKIL